MTTRNTVFEQNIIIKNIFAYCSSGVHEDFLTKKRGRKNKKLAIFLIVKTLVGKTCLIEPSIRNKQMNPYLLADCHLSKEIITQSQTLASRCNNSLLGCLAPYFLLNLF